MKKKKKATGPRAGGLPSTYPDASKRIYVGQVTRAKFLRDFVRTKRPTMLLVRRTTTAVGGRAGEDAGLLAARAGLRSGGEAEDAQALEMAQRMVGGEMAQSMVGGEMAQSMVGGEMAQSMVGGEMAQSASFPPLSFSFFRSRSLSLSLPQAHAHPILPRDADGRGGSLATRRAA